MEKTKKMGETLIDGSILTRFPTLRRRKTSEDEPIHTHTEVKPRRYKFIFSSIYNTEASGSKQKNLTCWVRLSSGNTQLIAVNCNSNNYVLYGILPKLYIKENEKKTLLNTNKKKHPILVTNTREITLAKKQTLKVS